jgi:hypothetical protein
MGSSCDAGSLTKHEGKNKKKREKIKIKIKNKKGKGKEGEKMVQLYMRLDMTGRQAGMTTVSVEMGRRLRSDGIHHRKAIIFVCVGFGAVRMYLVLCSDLRKLVGLIY